jgi:DNA polymerase V
VPRSYAPELAQICHLGAMPAEERNAVFATTAVGEVWGVGRRIGAKLTEGGISSVLDLVRMDAATVRRHFSVVLEKTVRELQGVPCIELDDEPAPKQQIMCSRSFGEAVTRGRDLAEALTEFTSRAAVKLRAQQGAAGAVHVFIRTSPFRKDDAQYANSVTVPLVQPTADTASLVHAALRGLRQIYRPGFRYAKAGVMLVELQPQAVAQAAFDFDGPGQALTANWRSRPSAVVPIAANPLSATTGLKVQLTLANAGPRIRLLRSSRSTKPRTNPRA